MTTSHPSDAAALPGIDHAASAASLYFPVLTISLVVLNVFTFLYHFTGSTLFNVISNFVGIALLAFSLYVIAQHGDRARTAKIFLIVAGILIALSAIFNFAVASTTDAIKYLTIYILYAAGRSCGGSIRPIEVRCLYALAALPLLFLAMGTSKPFAIESFASEVFAYFPNANTGVLYFSALLFAAAQRYGDKVILLQLVNAVLMNRMGAVAATVVAVVTWIMFPLRLQSLVLMVLIGLGGALAYSFGAFDRVITTIENLSYVGSIDPRSVATMSYGQLVRLTGSTDLSSFFRLIHWTNIWDLYTNNGFMTLLFGYGAGQTALLTYSALVPHNDYLRILAEYGIFNLIVFVAFLLHVRSNLTSGATKVLFLVLCIYFFSENLLDNFTSMALFFAYAGRVATAADQPQADAAAEEFGSHHFVPRPSVVNNPRN
jgi:hypothetical protein